MKKFVAAISLSVAVALPAFAADTTITLPASGTLGTLNLAAGQTAQVNMPNAVGCVDFGIYERAGTITTASVDVVGGGYRKTGASLRLIHLYGTMKSATVTAHQNTGMFHVVYKSMTQSSCLKMARTQTLAH
jgi:hypothetical protein